MKSLNALLMLHMTKRLVLSLHIESALSFNVGMPFEPLPAMAIDGEEFNGT
jgi:hypothetical protein